MPGGDLGVQGQVELEGSIVPGVGSHLVFPQLIPVDGVAGSDGQLDTPVVLRYAVLSGDNVNEQARVLYSGLNGNTILLGNSSVSAMFPGGCTGSCFQGDYRYGAFFEKEGSTLRYFTPWTGEVDGTAGIHAIGATVDVVPQ